MASSPPVVNEVPAAESPPGGGDESDVAETVIRCHRMEPWGDICRYENLCFDGDVLYRLDNSAPKELTSDREWSGVCV